MRKWAKLYATGSKFGTIGKERKEVNPKSKLVRRGQVKEVS
jgi:hypothetical protein